MARGPSKSRFEEIFRDGKRAVGPFCRISALPGKGLLGFTTARKLGNRPRRNKMRRKFQEALRLRPGCIDSRLDYVVVIGARSESASFGEIGQELESLMADLGVRWAKDLESC